MKATMKIMGGRALEDALEKLKDTTREKIVQESLAKGAEPLRDMAASLAPRHTGMLSRSIAIGTKLTRRQKSTSQKLSAVEVYVGPSPGKGRFVGHGVFNEFGTVKMRPRPFMRPAFAKTVDQIIAIVKNQMWLKIKLVADRADKSGLGP